MRKSLWTIALALMGTLAPTVLKATDITYNVNETVGAGEVTGVITTDGAIGTLTTADILNWNLTINNGTNAPFDLLGPLSGNNSSTGVFGADLTATSSQLLFNYSAAGTGALYFEQGTLGDDEAFLGYCTGTTDCEVLSSGPVIALDPVAGDAPLETHLAYSVMSGNTVIASVAAAVPEVDPTTGTSALALIIGAVLVIRGRRSKTQLKSERALVHPHSTEHPPLDRR